MFWKLYRGVIVVVLLALAASVWAQDAPVLVPYRDNISGIEGVHPEGWTPMGTGVFGRASNATDSTVLVMQGAPVTEDALWQSLLPQFGLERIPPSAGTIQTTALEWTLYAFEQTQNGAVLRFDVGIAADAARSYLVMLQTTPEEYDTLHLSVFMPVLEAFAPLVTGILGEAVTFTNGNVTLAGTLTLPETDGPHPAVVLMTGSGPQNRDEEAVPGLRIFQLIADHLTERGVAVLRYDDRGVGQSTGDFLSASIQDFAADAQAAVAYLRGRQDIDPEQVGVLGHSEGGAYAAMLGAKPDSGIAFIIALAGPAVSSRDLLLEQNRRIYAASGAPEAVIDLQLEFLNESFPLVAERNWEAVEDLMYESITQQWALLPDEARNSLGGNGDAYARSAVQSFRQNNAAEWYATLQEYNAAADWARTTVPVLAVFGGLDMQVPAEMNSVPLTEALKQAGNRDYEVVVLPDANHLFQSAVTGSPLEYAQLATELTPDLLPTLSEWLLEHVTLPQD